MASSPPLFAPLVPTASRPSQVVEMLSADIRAGIYQPKGRLPTEQELIARFAVSRTVIREALASLKAEGLIVTRQGSGAFVAENPFGPPFRITPDEMHSVAQMIYLLQLRLAVEVEAAGIAAENRTPRALERMTDCLQRIDGDLRTGTSVSQGDYEFHLAIAAATGNPYFERFIRFLRSTLRPGRELNPALKDPTIWHDYFSRVQEQHRDIRAAIEKQDADGARQATRNHLEGALAEYRKMADYHPATEQRQPSE